MKITRLSKTLLSSSLALALLMSACLPFLSPSDQGGLDDIQTAAAQTVFANVTLSAGETAVAQLTQIGFATPTATFPTGGDPTEAIPTSTFTSTPTATIPPSLTPLPTATNTPLPPTATPTQVPCDWAQFVKDVTVPDGTVFLPGSMFNKVWRLKNIGSCTWTSGYALVFESGDRLDGRSTVPFPGVVRPGETVDLAVELIAPAMPGRYRGYWILSNPSGARFGIGARANKAFWVDIQVQAVNSPYPYDFALNMCAATWRSSARTLPCPGNSSDPNGSAILLTAPVLETGKKENEQTLWTRPELARDGWIMGVYPSYRVQAGDHFMADIGCLLDSTGCDVTFFLSYQASGQPVRDLGSWREVYDGALTRIDVDLSALAGQSVQFMLSVVNNGRPADANAFWLVPSIRRVNPAPWWDSVPAVQAARATLAQDLGVGLNQVTVTYAVAVEWNDTCLGVHLPGQVCAPAIIPGYRVLLTVGARNYEAHTDQNGTTVLWFEL